MATATREEIVDTALTLLASKEKHGFRPFIEVLEVKEIIESGKTQTVSFGNVKEVLDEFFTPTYIGLSRLVYVLK